MVTNPFTALYTTLQLNTDFHALTCSPGVGWLWKDHGWCEQLTSDEFQCSLIEISSTDFVTEHEVSILRNTGSSWSAAACQL